MGKSRPPIDDDKQLELINKVSRVFSPAAPINRRDLFSGRIPQLQRVVDAIGTRGQHAVIFGERGVGKTSLANIVLELVRGDYANQDDSHVVKVNCSQDDSFASIWKKALSEIVLEEETGQGTIGYRMKPITEEFTAAEALPEIPSPNDIRRVVQRLGTTVVVLDEFDRIKDGQGLFADTIKTLSDMSTDCTLVLVGVAQDIDDLIGEHASISRAIVEILMPPMTAAELHEILNRAMKAIGMDMEAEARNLIVLLSQGLPHYTHVLGKASTSHAIYDWRWDITLQDVHASINAAIENSQQSIRNAYQSATASPRKDAIFKQVLLACALAPLDDLGFFASADVREPLQKIIGRQCDVSAFSGHIEKFASPERGNVLERSGSRRRYRYRFSNPLLQPFIIIRGIADNLLKGALMPMLQRKAAH